MEEICFITNKRAGALIDIEYNKERLGKEIHISLKAILTKEEQNTYHFLMSKSENVKVLED